MLASEILNEKTQINNQPACLARAVALLFVLMATGCCQMVLRGPSRNEYGSPILDCVDPNQCEPADQAAFNRLQEFKANLQMHRGQASARMSDSLHVCSAKMSDRWNQSRIAQWKAEHREKLSAPPYPKFHPLPTHPAFYPESALPE